MASIPFIKKRSNKAVSGEVGSDREKDAPKKQSLSIALEMQRRTKPKKMFNGGPTPTPSPGQKSKYQQDTEDFSKGAQESGVPGLDGAVSKFKSALGFAEGGEICAHCSGSGHMPHKMADGGEVEEMHDQEGPGASLKENYDAKSFKIDDYEDIHQPEESNEHSIDLVDEDEHDKDMISKIMKKNKKMK